MKTNLFYRRLPELMQHYCLVILPSFKDLDNDDVSIIWAVLH